jgi:CubicO group peptidase (beta-lactamase class C family)
MRYFFVLVFVAVLIAPAQAITAHPDADLTSRAETVRQETGAPAVAIATLESGELRVGVSGSRERGGEVPVTIADLWHIGSDTKSMTATLVARLVERGVIGWNDTVADHLGDVVGRINPAYLDMTFLHLLGHRAGLPANVRVLQMIRFSKERIRSRPIHEQRLDYAAQVLTRRPAVTPEEGFLYSNAGYVVAGAMIEQATGQSWESLMVQEVFEPLGMTTAGFGAPGSPDTVDQPRGHLPTASGESLAVPPGPDGDNPPVLGPAGTVHLSLEDLMTFLGAHMDGARGEETEYLSEESWETLHTPPFGGNYALGWGVAEGTLQHAGSNLRWFVQIAFRPDDNRAIIIAFNDGRIGPMSAATAEITRDLFESAE